MRREAPRLLTAPEISNLYEQVRGGIIIKVPFRQSDSALGYSLPRLLAVTDERTIDNISGKRPDIALALSSRLKPLIPEEVRLAVTIARDRDSGEEVVFAMAAVANTLAGRLGPGADFQELESLSMRKTLSPVKKAFDLMLGPYPPSDEQKTFKEVASMKPSKLAEIKSVAPIGSSLIGVGLGFLGTTFFKDNRELYCLIGGTGIALTLMSAIGYYHIQSLIAQNRYSKAEINEIRRNLVLFNELTQPLNK